MTTGTKSVVHAHMPVSMFHPQGGLCPSKYQKWYDGIITAAAMREMPRCYSELHHIRPRSLSGADDPSNLVRLTYREHFLAHWLLTKICVGSDLRRMQRAMFAMTLKCSAERVTTGWQFETAKQAVCDLELDPELERLWRERFEAAKAAKLEALRVTALRAMVDRVKLKERVLSPDLETRAKANPRKIAELATEFLRAHKRPRRQNRVKLFDSPSREDRVRQAKELTSSAKSK